VGGIDFGNLLPGLGHLETATLAQTFINPLGQPNGTGAGQAYGVISTINGDSTYCATPTGTGCTLYYVADFGGATFTSPTDVFLTSNEVKIYYSNANPVNLLGQNSPANVALIQALTPWASMSGHGNLGGGNPPAAVIDGFGNLSGASLNLITTALLDVNTGDGFGNATVEQFLDGNGIPDAAAGFADIAYTESTNNFVLNANDVSGGFSNGCFNGTAATGAWCWQGSMNIRGNANIPEPGTIALLSLGLMSAGFVTRRRSRQQS